MSDLKLTQTFEIISLEGISFGGDDHLNLIKPCSSIGRR